MNVICSLSVFVLILTCIHGMPVENPNERGGVSLGQFCAAVFQCGGHMPPFCNGVVGKTERSSVSRGRPASCKGKDLTSNAGQFDLPSEILRMYCAFLLAMGEEITAEHICYDGN